MTVWEAITVHLDALADTPNTRRYRRKAERHTNDAALATILIEQVEIFHVYA